MPTLTADRAARTLTADPLLPFGEQGSTNLGRVTASAGAIAIPDDVSGLVLNLQHERNAPIAKFTSVTETPTGLRATFSVPATRAGDDLLAEVDAGLRTGVSVEIANPVIRDGALLGGTLTGAAAVVDPAFPSAQLVAADAGELPAGFPEYDLPGTSTYSSQTTEEIVIDGVTYTVLRKSETTDTTTVDVNAAQAAGSEPTVPNTQQVNAADATETEPTLSASVPNSLRTRPANRPKGDANLFAQFTVSDLSGRTALKSQLNAALDVANAADLSPTMAQQWLGEVHAQLPYTRRIANLIGHGDLAGMKAIGWRFIEGKTPTVGDFSGAPAGVTSTETKTEAVTLDAARLAGAGAVDRAWVDFPVPEFWTGFYRECDADYERKIDAKVLAALIAGATAVTYTGAAPAGVSTAAAYLVRGAVSVITAERGVPTFAVVGSDLYEDFLLTRVEDTLAYLTAALRLEEGSMAGFNIQPSADASMTGAVLVGTKGSATLFELPGASPTRVDSVDISTGEVVTGVFGYHAELIRDSKALALVKPAV